MKQKDNIEFVTRHYRPGAFDTRKAWQRTGIGTPRRRVWQWAAAVGVLLAVSATAGIVHRMHTDSQNDAPQSATIPADEVSRPINFDAAPLPRVVAEIERVYGVKVTNLPPNAHTIVVTMHYEGTVASLIATLNETFDINLRYN